MAELFWLGCSCRANSSSVGLVGTSLADRRRPLSAALQAETPWIHDEPRCFLPTAATAIRCFFPSPLPPLLRLLFSHLWISSCFPTALPQHQPPLDHHLPLSRGAAAAWIYYLFLCNKYFALTPVPLTKLRPAAANCRSKVRFFSAGVSETMLAAVSLVPIECNWWGAPSGTSRSKLTLKSTFPAK